MSIEIIDITDTIPKHKTRKWSTQKKIERIVIHTSASNNQDPNKTALYHITPGEQNHISKRGAPSLCYHEFGTKDGKVYLCNTSDKVVWHSGNNRGSYSYCMAFKGQTGEKPVALQYEVMLRRMTQLCLQFKLAPIKKHLRGHREEPHMWTLLKNGSKRYKKSCPGWGVDLDAVRKRVAKRMQVILAEEGLYEGEIDGLFGKLSKAALKQYQPE